MWYQRRYSTATMLHSVIVILAIASAGCISLKVSVEKVDVPISLTPQLDREYVMISHFSIEQNHSMLFLKRLVGAGHPDFTAMVQKQLILTPGDAIVNLKIIGDTNGADVLLPIFVGGAGAFVTPFFLVFVVQPLFADLKSYSLEGDVVRYVDTNIGKKKEQPPPPPQFDPVTGLPIEQPKPVEFDPETGLPKK